MNNNEMIDHAYMYGYNYVTTTSSRNCLRPPEYKRL